MNEIPTILPVHETSRLRLRMMLPSDQMDLFAICGDPEVDEICAGRDVS